jgi:hypothetical protein
MEAKRHDLEEQYDESLSHAAGGAVLPDAVGPTMRRKDCPCGRSQ